MAPRPNWKGYLKLSLVSCSIALYRATTTNERTHFNVINRETGNRVRYDVVDAESGEEVPQEDRVKGYRKGKGDDYVLLEDGELDQVALESTHTIDIESFVPREQVDELYLDESYYIVPDEEVGYEAFAVIRDALEKKKLVGLARVVLSRREHLVMLEPRDKGVVATLLRYRDEVRDWHDYFDDIPDAKVSKDMLELAEHILASKKTKFDPSKFEDRYETALKKLIAAKAHGKKPPPAPTPQPTNVINLMDALRRSVKGGRGAKPSHDKPSHDKPSRARRGKTSAKRAGAARAHRSRRKLKRAS
jgi:DNA end-binding protein Ku